MSYAHGILKPSTAASNTAASTYYGSVPQPGLKPVRGLGTIPQTHTGVQGAIARASARTGVDFSFLVDKANVESSMNPQATAKNSTATGLYQFIEKTWLQMVRDHGEKYGLKNYAECINENCQVNNPKMRQKILDLRKDPETAACMAAEYANQNAEILQQRVGNITDIGNTELYLAHFLGPGGATKFIEAMHDNPNARGTAIFPAEARTNRGVFYDADTGKSRTLAEIYNFFDSKFDSEPTNDVAAAMNSIEPGSTDKTANDSVAWVANPDCSDMTIALNHDIVEKLLASPPKPFGPPDEESDDQEIGFAPLQDVVTPAATRLTRATLPVAHQAALMVLAQGYAHEDATRYNS